jgi:hypothetical protein
LCSASRLLCWEDALIENFFINSYLGVIKLFFKDSRFFFHFGGSNHLKSVYSGSSPTWWSYLKKISFKILLK